MSEYDLIMKVKRMSSGLQTKEQVNPLIKYATLAYRNMGNNAAESMLRELPFSLELAVRSKMLDQDKASIRANGAGSEK